jgi:Leucine-rich repeat (LRR) protein
MNNHNNIFGYANIDNLMEPVGATNVETIMNMEHLGLFVNNANFDTLNAFLINNNLPPNLTDLECDNNNLSQLPELPDNLEWLSCNNNKLKSLPYLPDNLQYLYCDDNELIEFPDLPYNLKDLHCTDNKMQGPIDFLPDKLEILSFSNNQIIRLPEIPQTLVELECANNKLTTLPELRNTELIKLNFDNNSIVDLPDLPDSLRELSCRGNPFSDESIQKLIIFYEKDTTREYRDTEINAEEELKYYNLYVSKVVSNALNTFGDPEKGHVNPDTKIKKEINIPQKPIFDILEYANLQKPPPKSGGRKSKKSKKSRKIKKSRKTKKSKKSKKIRKTKRHNK